MIELLSIRDCAKRLGVASHRIAYAHETGKLADTEYRVAGKRIYTVEDLRRVADYFGIKTSNRAREGREDEN
jgi:hypothetical protein